MPPRYDIDLSAVDTGGWVSATVKQIGDDGEKEGEPRLDLTLVDDGAGYLVAWSSLLVGAVPAGGKQVYACLAELMAPVEGGDVYDARFGLTASVVVDETIVAQSEAMRYVSRVRGAWCEGWPAADAREDDEQGETDSDEPVA